MLEVVVKTLDSQNHKFSVPDESTVKEFKAQIAPVLNIAAEKQRLIFCGKVLKDDKKLSEYDVNGKVIHVVQSLPPQGNTSTTSTSSTNSTSATGGPFRSVPVPSRDAAGFLLGAFAIPQEMVDPSQVQNIVQDVAGLGDIGRNATVVSRTTEDGSVDVHINLGRVPVQVPLHSEAQLRMNRIQTMLIRANHLLDSLEDVNNSNNGAVADSSSQTETENASSRNTGSESRGRSQASSSSDTITAELNISTDIPSDMNLEGVTMSTETDRFRFEGLAHAAQAAISAAFAAAARAATSSLGSTSASPSDDGDQTEPMDLTPPVAGPLPGGAQPEDTPEVPMETQPSEPGASATSSKKPAASADSESHHPDCPFSAAQTPPTTTAPSAQPASTTTRRPGAAHASVQTLANLLDEVIRVNTRLQPCLERCRDLIRRDPVLTGRALGDAHRLFSRISQLMHFLGHAYHSLSDLHVNFNQVPPRNPSVRIISSSHNPPLFPGIPVQAQISISTSSVVVPSSSQSTTTTANNASSGNARNSNSEARPVPAPRVSQAPPSVNPLSYMAGSQSPVVFMEVSPGSVTIDSISSIATPLGAFSSTTTDASQNNASQPNATPTPATASSRESRTSGTEPNASAPRSAPRSSSANANGPSSQTVNNPFQNLIPVPMPSMGSLHTFDAGLPCNSVWALEPSRRRHNAGGSRSSSTSGITPNAPGRQDNQLQQIIGNIMMTILNNAIPPDDLFANEPRNPARQEQDRNIRPPTPPNALFNYRLEFTDSNMLFKKVCEVLPNLHFNSETICGSILNFLMNTMSFNSLINIMEGKSNALDKYEGRFHHFIQSKIKNWNKDIDDKKEEMVQVAKEIEDLIKSFPFEIKSGREESFYQAARNLGRNHVFKVYQAAVFKSSDDRGYGVNLMEALRSAFHEFMEILRVNTNHGYDDLRQQLMDSVGKVISALPLNQLNAIREFFFICLLKAEQSFLSAIPGNPIGRKPNSNHGAASSSSPSAFPELSETEPMTEDYIPWVGGTPKDILRVDVLQKERLKRAITKKFKELGIYDRKIIEILGDSVFNPTLCGSIMKLFAETLSYRDLIDVSFKQYQCLNKHIPHFFKFVSENYFDITLKSVNVQKLKDLCKEVKSILISFTNGLPLRNRHTFEHHVDRFFKKCVEVHLPELVKVVIDESDQSSNQFGKQLFSVITKIFKEFVDVIGRHAGYETFVFKVINAIDEETFGISCDKLIAVQSLFKNMVTNLTSFIEPRSTNATSASPISQPNSENAAGTSSYTLELPLMNFGEKDDDYLNFCFQLKPIIKKTIGEVFSKSIFDQDTFLGRIMNFVYDNLTFQDVIDLRFFYRFETLTKHRIKGTQFVKDILGDASAERRLKSELKTFFLAHTTSMYIPDETAFNRHLDRAIQSSVSQFLCVLHAVNHDTFGKVLLSAVQVVFTKILFVFTEYTEDGLLLLKKNMMAALDSIIDNIQVPPEGPGSTNLDLSLRLICKEILCQCIKVCFEQSKVIRQKCDEMERVPTNRPEPLTRPTSSSATSQPRRLNIETPRVSGGAPTLAQLTEQTSSILRSSERPSNVPPPVHGLTRVVIGSEGWHNSVPRDWVPIITRDVHCQRRQAPQAPFSNGYLSGMPSKRRKIMTNGNTTLLEPSQTSLSDMLLQAILSADVKPKTNMEEVKKEAAQNAPLQESFNQHMKQAIRERLNCDSDYLPDRFPNAEKYFN